MDSRAQAYVDAATRFLIFVSVGYVVSFLVMYALSRSMEERYGFDVDVDWARIGLRAGILFVATWGMLRAIIIGLDLSRVVSWVPAMPFESLVYDADFENKNEVYKRLMLQKYYNKKGGRRVGNPKLFEMDALPPAPSPAPLPAPPPAPAPAAFHEMFLLQQGGGGDGGGKGKVGFVPNPAAPTPLAPNYQRAAVDKVKDAAVDAYAAVKKVVKKGKPGGRNSHIGKGKGGKYGYGFKKNGKPAKKPGRKEKKKKAKKNVFKRRTSD